MSNSKPNAGLEDAARLLDLVPFLISHQGISLEELAQQFSVTSDEITSDLTTLWMCGLPGYTAYELIDLSFDSGFVTIANADTLQRPRNLQRNEALALLLGLETLLEEVTSNNPELETSISQLINRISLTIDQSASQRVKAGTPSSSAQRAQITKAIRERALLKIIYHSSAQDEVGERLIKPLEITTLNGVEYLEAFCHRSFGYRTFRLDRIISAQIDKLPPTVELSLEREGNELDGQTQSSFSFRIVSRARDVLERFGISHSNNSITEEISTQSFSPEWTIREVMSFGGGVVISSPKSLRSAVRNRAVRALEGYSH